MQQVEPTTTLKINTHVRVVKDKAQIQEECERALLNYFDNVIFRIDQENLKRTFVNRLRERQIKDKADIRLLFDNWRFTEEEKDFWIRHALTLHNVFGQPNARPENFLLCLLSYAADPRGLQVGNNVYIYPDKKMMMRFPLPSEILGIVEIECSVITSGKKKLQMADWSLYPYSQIKQ
jgi:hypothetical protein